jgi:hypothetical protein
MNLGRVNLGVRQERLSMAPAQMAVSLCVLLALISLGASLLVGQPLELRPAAPATLLPLVSGLLGLAAGVLGLHASQNRPPRPGAKAFEPTFAGPPSDAAALLNDLRGLLDEVRQAAAAMREQCAATGHEALVVGARMTGAALDLEHRLAASVGLAEQALQNPGGALARGAAATRRVERAIGDLTDLIKSGAHDVASPSSLSMDQALAGLAGHVVELREVAARLEAATPGLDRVQEVGLRLCRVTETLPAAIEHLVAAVPAAIAQLRQGKEEVLF